VAEADDLTDAAVEAISAAIVERARRGEPLAASGVTLLVRQYRRGCAGVGDVLGDALARALVDHRAEAATASRAAWAAAFAEAMTVSEDARLAEAVLAAVESLAAEWPALTCVDAAAVSIDACLRAAPAAGRPEIVASAVDTLERVVAAAYRPGNGVAHRHDGPEHVRGSTSDHVCLAAALLTAFELSGRLPYSMLAEELIQTSRPALSGPLACATACAAARVLCRLARLHDDAEYRAAAVIAGGADYRGDAARILSGLTDQLRGGDADDADAALYAIALDEWSSDRK